MKKFEGMLFCTDLDGTLYTEDKRVSRENLDAIEYFKSEGGLFTFITGRVPMTSGEICETIKPNAPYGCINGGGIYDPTEKRYLWSATLPESALELVRSVDRDLPEIGIQFNTEKDIYFNKDNRAMEIFRELTGIEKVTCSFEELSEPLLKVVLAHDDEGRIEELIAYLKRHELSPSFDFIRSEKMLYEILPKGVSKGSALLKLSELLAIDPKMTVTAGDYHNDISMLRAAGRGFAVSNAVDEVKAAADYITVSNDENAIAAIIDGLDRGIYPVNK
ncbi:MAG: HAD family phosphatase [Ruminococcaceae bacterium]|nr:HAD family phosphatase [Oscillospiraceae bacterium]